VGFRFRVVLNLEGKQKRDEEHFEFFLFLREEEENKNVCAAVAHHHHHLERLEFIFFLEIRSWWGCFWPGAFSSISESKKPPPSV
jgi:hypothetical protein